MSFDENGVALLEDGDFKSISDEKQVEFACPTQTFCSKVRWRLLCVGLAVVVLKSMSWRK